MYDFKTDDCTESVNGPFTKKCIGQGGRISVDSENQTRICGGISAKKNCERGPLLVYDFDADICTTRSAS